MISIHPLTSNSFPKFWGPFQVLQLQLVSPLLSYYLAFLILCRSPSTCLSFRFLSFSLCDQPEKQSLLYGELFFFFLLIIDWFDLLVGIRLFVCISISILPLIFSFPNILQAPVTVPCTPTTIGISVTFKFNSFVRSLVRLRHLSIFSLPFIFTLWFVLEQQNSIDDKFFYFIFIFGRDWVIRLYLKATENFVSPFRGRTLICAYAIC